MEPDEAAAKKEFAYRAVMIPLPGTRVENFGNEGQVWRSGSGGTIIFRRGTVVIGLSGLLPFEELSEAATQLDKKISAISEEALREQLADFKNAYSAGKKAVEAKVADVLSAEDKRKAVDALVMQLQTVRNDGERQKAVLALGNLGDSSAVATLLPYVDSKYSTGTRNQAIHALARLGSKEAVPVLLEILQKPATGNIEDEGENEAIVRRAAVTALGKIGDKSALPVLKDVQQRDKEYKSVKELAEISEKKIDKKSEE